MVDPTPLRPASLHEEVATRIRNMVFDRQLAPGQWVDELALAREWQQTIAALALDTVECLEIVTEIDLKPGLKGHPYYHGKMSLLQTLRHLADEDVKRFETPGATALIRAIRNAALEEAAVEIEALERGVYTSAQTPAGLVRAMKTQP